MSSPRSRNPRIAAEVDRIHAANPEQYKLARLYLEKGITLPEAVAMLKRAYIAAALCLPEVQFKKARAAKASGMHRNTVDRIMPTRGIGIPAKRAPVPLPQRSVFEMRAQA